MRLSLTVALILSVVCEILAGLDGGTSGAAVGAVVPVGRLCSPELCARRAFDSHLSRAKWMTEHGYRLLLRGGASV